MMRRFKSVCEIEGCCDKSVGEFQRLGDERIGWDKNMGIDLCEKHSERHIPAYTIMVIINGELILKLLAKKGFKLRKIYKKPGKSINQMSKDAGIAQSTVCRRIKRGQKLKEAVKPSTYRKQVIMLNMNNEEVKRFNSAKEAGLQANISAGNICEVLRGNRNHAGGYIFKYAS